jgi:hypothetical protein
MIGTYGALFNHALALNRLNRDVARVAQPRRPGLQAVARRLLIAALRPSGAWRLRPLISPIA